MRTIIKKLKDKDVDIKKLHRQYAYLNKAIIITPGIALTLNIF